MKTFQTEKKICSDFDWKVFSEVVFSPKNIYRQTNFQFHFSIFFSSPYLFSKFCIVYGSPMLNITLSNEHAHPGLQKDIQETGTHGSPLSRLSRGRKRSDTHCKATALGRVVVRETNVSRHHGGKMRVPLKLPVHHNSFISRGLRETLNWLPLYRETLHAIWSLRACWHLESFEPGTAYKYKFSLLVSVICVNFWLLHT